MEDYFIITASDGEPSIQQMSKEMFLENLNDDYYGEDVHFLGAELPNDLTYLGNNQMIVIKGAVVIPKAKEVVKKYDIEEG